MRLGLLAGVIFWLTFALLLLGGAVHATGSSLACPDWPLCYGRLFPEMSGGIFWEHTHRLVGAGVGLATAVLAVLLLRRAPAAEQRLVGGLALAMAALQVALLAMGLADGRGNNLLHVLAWALALVVIGVTVWLWRQGQSLAALAVAACELIALQGMLGGLTVVLGLPVLVSTGHLVLSLLFLLLMLLMWNVLGRHVAGGGPRDTSTPAFAATLVAAAMTLVLMQSVLGGLVRHTGSGFGCGTTVFTCDGVLLPPWGAGLLNWTHRLAALAAVAAVVLAAWPGLRARLPGRRLARAAVALAVLQLLVGAAAVMHYPSAIVNTIHLGVAALLLALLLQLHLGARRVAAGSEPAPVGL